MEPGSHITLKSGRLRISIAAASIRQIVPAEGITRIPLTKTDVAGVLARDGRAIPIYEIAALVRGGATDEHDTDRRQIVIVERDGMLAGLLVAGTESSSSQGADPSGLARVIDGDVLLHSSGIFDAGKGGDHAALAAEGDS